MSIRIHSANLVRFLFVLALVLPLAMSHFASARAATVSAATASLQPGIDCGCDLTGSYETPVAPIPISLAIQPNESPNEKYQVVWQYGNGQITSLRVIRKSDGHDIVTLSGLPNSTYWSFSPDDDRFALYSIRQTYSGSQTTYYLYNLARATNPGLPVWNTTTSLVDTEAAFSPNGHYFQYTRVDSGTSWLMIRDARTGARIFETSFNAAPPPGGGRTRVASWGYSPDTADRTFVYAYVNSQSTSSVFWGVVNLATGQLVRDELLVNAISSQTIRPFWKFSPCGDAIGLVNTAVTPTNIRLFATSGGTPLNAAGLDIMTSGTVLLENNLANHYVDTDSATHTLASNTADAACSVAPGGPALQSLSISPASLTGGTTAQGTVRLSAPAPSGGVVVNLAIDTSAAQLPSSVTVPAGSSSATFTITTSQVSADTWASISAMLGSTTRRATLAIFPPLASLTMSRYGLIAGATEIGTVTLRDPAPAGGAVVYLSGFGSFRTLNWVRVPEGEKSATFEVTANPYIESPEATLIATYLGASKTIDLTILRASSLAVTPVEVTGGLDTVTLTAGLSGPAPAGGIAVPLSADPAGIVALPPSLTIESGQTSASFVASTVAIDEDAEVTILAGVPEDTESPTATVHVLAAVPTALPGGPYVVLAGQPVTLAGAGTDPTGESLTFAWDLDGDETFETAGAMATFTDTAGQNRDVPMGFRACNTSGFCGTAQTFVRVRNLGQVWIVGPEPLQDIGMPSDEMGIPDGPTPALVEGFGDVIDVAGSEDLVVALRADGTVWTMGTNFYGQLGDPSLDTGWLPDGRPAHSSVPVQADIADVVAIASNGEHVLALKQDGTVWAWGSNRYLALGNGTADWNAHPKPTQVKNVSGVVDIAASKVNSFALTRTGEIYGWGYGDNIYGRACNTAFPCRIATISETVALQLTNSWAIVLKRDGTVWFWGGYDPVTMEDRLDPEQIAGLSGITAISAADESFLALKNDGTVWGFGQNDNGQLGFNPWPPYPRYERDHIGPVQIPGLAGIRAIASGDALQMALLQDGTVDGWGLVVQYCPEGCGEYWLPSPLAGLADVLSVAAGNDFRLAIVGSAPSVPGVPDLDITQIADQEMVSSGDPIGLTITITNNGDGIASSVTLSDTLPADTGLSWWVGGTDAASCTTSAGIVSCNFGDMSPGAVKSIRLTSPTPIASGKPSCPVVSNTATVTANNQPEGRSATATVEVLCPRVYIDIWPDTPSVTAGDPIRYTFTVGNMGDGVARDVDSEAGLPNNPGVSWSITNVTPASAASNCSIDSSGTYPEMLCFFDELAAGQEVSITVSSPTTSGSCGMLMAGGTVTSSNGDGFRARPAAINVSCTVSAIVQPGEAATLILPDGRGQIEFPANLVAEPTTFTYTEQDAPSQELGSYAFVGVSFTLDATDSGGNPVTSFPASYTIRLTYLDDDWQSAGIADESVLNLAYWNIADGQWVNVLPCAGCTLNTAQNRLVAVLDHLTEFALLAPADTTPPATSALLSPEASASGWYAGPVTVTLAASDGESGVYSTEYNLNGAGWTTYQAPFVASSESTSSTVHNTVHYRSTDEAGNVEVTKSLTIQIDITAPTVSASAPLSGNAVQGGIKFGVNLVDALSGPASATLSIREADGAGGKEIGYENLAAVYNSTSGNWQLSQAFDTTQLPDGFYLLVATGQDLAGNEKTAIIPFSVRNWAVLELLPATENNKAGRTMPVKFSLRVAQQVDPAQPFVYSEELTITIYGAGEPLQQSTFGPNARDYRIHAAEQTYIANFQTLKTPMQYTVEIRRDALLIGTFGFQTTK